MGKKDIRVAIIDDPSRQECDAACGIDWSSPEALDLARQQIRERFGGDIQLTYLDLTKDTTGTDTAEWNEAIGSKNLSVPLLLLNGNLRISGNFDIRQLMDIIEVESELGV